MVVLHQDLLRPAHFILETAFALKQRHNVHDGDLNAAVHTPVLYAMLRVCVCGSFWG